MKDVYDNCINSNNIYIWRGFLIQTNTCHKVSIAAKGDSIALYLQSTLTGVMSFYLGSSIAGLPLISGDDVWVLHLGIHEPCQGRECSSTKVEPPVCRGAAWTELALSGQHYL